MSVQFRLTAPMIDFDKMRFGLKVIILVGEHYGKIAYVENPADNNFPSYLVVIPGIEEYFQYRIEDIELG